MRVLVTGGAGYIGSHLCKALVKAGHFPVVFDNLSVGWRWAVKWGEFFEGDVRHAADLWRAYQRFAPQCVVHLAAQSNGRESSLFPKEYYDHNVIGTASILKLVEKQRIPYLVFASSCAVYGIPGSGPIGEECRKEPVHPYGFSKKMAEGMIEEHGRRVGTRYAILRFFNVAGADLEGEVGEAHDPETHLIPLLIRSGLRKNRPIPLFFERGSPPVRDFVHVVDAVDAIVCALKSLVERGRNMIVNIGSGGGTSVDELITAIEFYLGSSISYVMAGPPLVREPLELIADRSQAISTLGWFPRHSSLETIIHTAITWHSR